MLKNKHHKKEEVETNKTVLYVVIVSYVLCRVNKTSCTFELFPAII